VHRSSPRRKRNAQTILFRRQDNGQLQEVTFGRVVNAPGGKVLGYNGGPTPHVFDRRRVIAIDGVPLDFGGGPAARLAKSVPMPKSRYTSKGDVQHLRAFFDACRASRSLRTAVERLRAVLARRPLGEAVVCEGDTAFDVWATDESLDAAVQRDRPDAEFVGGSRWDQRGKAASARALFDAMLAWGVLEQSYEVQGKRCAGVGYDLKSLTAFPDLIAYIARELKSETSSSYLTYYHPAWRWFGLRDLEVSHALIDAQAYGLLTYYNAGTMVDISFP
jgi:hypothetical protein